MSGRDQLPHRREAETFEFQHAGFKYTATVGRFGDGRPAELFLSAGKAGTAVDVAARDAAILASLCLQRGATVSEIVRATAGGPVAAAFARLEWKESA